MKSAIFFSLAAWLCLSLGAFAQNTYYVDETGDDSSGDGSQAAPWKTIAYAVEQANANSTINVLTGTYNEAPILVDKSLTVSGIGQNVTVIASSANPLFSIAGNSITIEGLSLQPATSKSGIAILLKKVEGEAVDGINIAQNTISDFNSGIVFETNAEVTNLSISNNFITNNTNGIVVENLVNLDAQSSISNNNLSNNSNKSLINNSTVSVVNASANWWGGNAPSDVTSTLSASNINAKIDYNPWINAPTDIDLDNSNGFQPLLTPLNVRKQSNASVLFEALDMLPIGTGKLFVYNNNSFPYESITINKPVTIAGASATPPTFPEITLNSDLTISGTVIVQDLALNNNTLTANPQESGLIRLPVVLANALATESGLEGSIETLPQQVGSNEGISALGVTIAPGPEALGEVTILRNAGKIAIENPQNVGSQSIKVYWDIEVENDEFSERNLTLSWSSEYDNTIDTENVIVWKNPGSSIQDDNWVQVNDIGINSIINGSERAVTVGTTSFSQYTVSDVNNPLPVELTRFSAFLSEPHVELQWETASEINSDFFAIERSEDGKTFAQIGKLKAAGKSDTPLQYNYIDEQAANRLSGSVFYRLRTVDFDGSFEYSDITVVNINGDDLPMITAYAHAGQSHLRLFTRAIEAGDYQLWISDLSGRKVYEQNVQLDAKEVYEINVGQLPQSVYLIRCVGKELALSSKFRVEAGN